MALDFNAPLENSISSNMAVGAPKRTPEVAVAILAMEKDITSLAEAVNELERRVSEVMHPALEKAQAVESLKREGSYAVPLSSSLYNLDARIIEVRNRVVGILDRIEI